MPGGAITGMVGGHFPAAVDSRSKLPGAVARRPVTYIERRGRRGQTNAAAREWMRLAPLEPSPSVMFA